MQQSHITLLEVQNAELRESIPDRAEDLSPQHDLTILSREHSRTLEAELSRRQRSITRAKCSQRQCYCACHMSSTSAGKTWSLKVPENWNTCSKRTCQYFKRASLWISLTNIGIPFAILASLDVMWTLRQSFISPSLQVMRTVNWHAPAFALLSDIRWNQMEVEEARVALMDLFDSGAASALDILPNGESLPEVSFLRLGVRKLDN